MPDACWKPAEFVENLAFLHLAATEARRKPRRQMEPRGLPRYSDRCMSVKQKLANEIKAIVLTTLYFAVWFGMLVVLKELILADYDIAFRGFSAALIGALVVAKVVLVMEHVTLGQWVHKHPALVDVILRTLLYTVGVFVALLLEKAFEARHEYGGFVAALKNILRHRDMPHVWANSICVGVALLGFNILAVVRRHLGEGGLVRLFMDPPARKHEAD
jgi:hypothetical protein